MSRPRTPHDIAAALHLIAAQIGAMPNPDQPIGGTWGVHIGLDIKPDNPADVDLFSQALYGQPGQPQQMGSGWLHRSPGAHATSVDVDVYCIVEDPKTTRMREERDAALAELEALRKRQADALVDKVLAE